MTVDEASERSLQALFPDIAKEWHPTKNGSLTPSQVTAHSAKKVWWLYPYDDIKTGKHFDFEWEMAIDNRTSQGCGCPYLSGRCVWPGYNDLETQYPEIAAEWHPTKNGDLKPSQVSCGYGKKVWWLYPYDDDNTGKHFDFEWEATVNARTNTRQKCPYVFGRLVWPGFNDLATIYPEIAMEWDEEKNACLASEVRYNSSKSAWWKCKDGHSWKASLSNRRKGSGCPYCAGLRILEGYNDLKTLYPDLCLEWDYSQNTKSPNMVGIGNAEKYWWTCENGHSYKSSVSARVKGSGCPYCAGRYPIKNENDLLTLDPILASEWHPTKNGKLKPDQVKLYSNKKVWWKCEFGHEWQATINNRSNNRGCPYCSGSGSSIVEQGVAYYLSKIYSVEQRRHIGKYEVDVFLTDYSIGIEYDGVFYHSSIEAKKREEKKNIYLEKKGVKLFRIKESKNSNIIENDIVYYQPDDMGNNYKFAIASLIRLIGNTTGEKTNIDIDIDRDIGDIRERFVAKKKENSLEYNYPEIIDEWDYEKNGKLLPIMFAGGSTQKVWWKCKNGHSWKTAISVRTRGQGCPYCSGRRCIAGVNDLQTLRPDLMSEWDYDKNTIRPNSVSLHSNKKVWWKCENGHEYESIIARRVDSKKGCPFCTNRKVLKGFNDLETIYPQIAKEWDKVNNESMPSEVLAGSQKKAWWICEKGHSYEMSIENRIHAKKACPICAGRKVLKNHNDLCSSFPQIAREWNYKKNNELSPENVTCASNKSVWWKCEFGHEWKTSVAHRTIDGNGCPYCAGQKAIKGENDLLSVNPRLAKEWNYEKNEELLPSQVMPKSGKRVWWKCPICLHEWESTVANRTIKKSGCPNCKHKWIND